MYARIAQPTSGGAWWRFHNHAHGLARSFDFTEEPRDLSWYQGMCSALQTQDFSPFVQYAFASLRTRDGFRALRDATYFDLANGVMTTREVTDARDYRTLLTGILGADLGDEADALWRTIQPRAAERARKARSEGSGA